MAYSVEAINGCTKKIMFNFEDLDLGKEIEKAVKDKQKTVSMKGFRKGKAPLGMVQKMHGPHIESEALNTFVQKQYFEAVKKEEFKIVGYPNFENIKYDAGKSVSFDALVEVFPEVNIKDMAGLSFSKDLVEVAEEEVEVAKKKHLEAKAETKEVEDKTSGLDKGHFAVMNFQGETENGERPENMKGEEFLLEIGSNQFIPGFEDGMIGMKKGETKDVNVNFPSDYHAAELADAKVKFEVELLEIKEKIFPEFTDELAKELGFESSDDFYTKTKTRLETQKDRAANEKLHQEILEKLVSENEFEVPLGLVTQQEKHLQDDLKKTLSQQGFDEKMTEEYFSKWSGDMTTKAIFQVKSGLILDSIARENKIEASDADLDTKLEEMAGTSGIDIEQLKSYYTGDANAKSNMLYAIREEKTFEKIKEVIKVNS